MNASRLLALPVIALAVVQPMIADAATYHPSFSSRNSHYSSAARNEITKLNKEDIDEDLPVPVLFNAPLTSITDTWGEARSEGRTHEGTDILAPRGTPIVSPTDAVVTQISVDTLGGNYVMTANPGGESYYFAHLDAYADNLKVGDVLEPGDVIGYVGNTGDAAGGPTHLHFGIYANHDATNPFPRLKEEFTLPEKIEDVKHMLSDAKDEDALADQLVGVARSYFIQANMQGLDVPDAINDALVRNPAPATVGTGAGGLDLDVGSTGGRVTLLQGFLISQNSGPAAASLAKAGATGTFGPLTKSALAEYQSTHGISPASGYFGPLTRAYIAAHGGGAI